MIIAGIDPGTTRVGYAVVEGDRKAQRLRSVETIMIPNVRAHAERLAEIAKGVSERLLRDRVDGVALEKIFFSKNTKTAIAVAEARGIILLTARAHVSSIWEYTPSEVKRAVTGYGNADKESVRRMIELLFPAAELDWKTLTDDAIDAAAIAAAACTRESKVIPE